MSDYPIELDISFDDEWVTISHKYGVYGYPISELGADKLQSLLGADVDFVVYSQGTEYSKDDFEAVYGKADLSTMIALDRQGKTLSEREKEERFGADDY